MSPYPILTEIALLPAGRRFLRGPRRDVGELPALRPGTVLVFEVEGGYRAFTEGRHLRGTEDEVANAVSVSVVDRRDRSLQVEVGVPSSDLAHEFPLVVTFACAVTHPEKVVERHVQAAEDLERYLRDNADLMAAGLKHKIEEIHLLRPRLVAMVKAYAEFFPPRISGMHVEVVSADVRLPGDVRDHAMELKGIRRRAEADDLVKAVETKDVERLTGIIAAGSTATMGLAISRGHLSVAEALVMQREDEEQRKKELREAIQVFPQGSFDFVPMDVRAYIAEYMRMTVGAEAADRMFSDSLTSRAEPAQPEIGMPRPLDMEDEDD
ncbi:hypothetical protein JYK22_18195, partial [Nonomuraea sp. RK-328]|nr:hypothetical protein [Nonomuraea sp. RK-328]